MWGEKTVERDPESKIESPLFVALTVLKVLAKEFSFFICVAVLPPSGLNNFS